MIEMPNIKNICEQFDFKGRYESANPYGDGHINDTYKVTYYDTYDEPTHYILQRVNHLIFKNTEGLMENIENVTSYLSDIIIEDEQENDYEVLELIKTKEKKSFYKDDTGYYWRSYVFVENATGHTFAKSNDMLYEAGKAFGYFQKLLKDYPVKSLHETIIGFHHTTSRYAKFIEVMEADAYKRCSYCESEINFVIEHETITGIILNALNNGEIPYRVTHNDTKINNVLLDNESGVGRCVIDLDTVMPGSALYDYGDAIRSCASTIAEDGETLDLLRLDLDRYEAYTKGYIETIGHDLTDKEFELMPTAAILMTFECGMRFLTDYLNGDQYFKVHKKDHNLIRAKNQFKFVSEMERHISDMMAIVNKYRRLIQSDLKG